MSYKNPQAFLVDMDGTMVDSEKFWVKSEAEVVSRYGKVMPEELSLKLIGTSAKQLGKTIVEYLDIDVDSDRITEEIIECVENKMLSESLEWRPGAKELLIYANKNEIPIVLVTSSHSRLAKIFVEKAKKIDGKGFNFYIAGDHVQYPKPNPQPYEIAAEKLGVDISQCIILEDSNSGIKAGASSGGRTVAIPFMGKLEHIENISWVKSIKDLTPERIDIILSGENIDLLS
ncbi:HAD family phosphatase [Actinomyces sp. zg-332]|uniref:HAD family hydrolase n=1 Tax=Actinomyces sp. zg-332 TaxID=2708340 RepID=UPI00141E698E|nr:HAD family phosphatase [Actinomyces sp. zg-332]QPK93696.1 HAD family phosphatase [Actinomyces sp. zg-332]